MHDRPVARLDRSTGPLDFHRRAENVAADNGIESVVIVVPGKQTEFCVSDAANRTEIEYPDAGELQRQAQWTTHGYKSLDGPGPFIVALEISTIADQLVDYVQRVDSAQAVGDDHELVVRAVGLQDLIPQFLTDRVSGTGVFRRRDDVADEIDHWFQSATRQWTARGQGIADTLVELLGGVVQVLVDVAQDLEFLFHMDIGQRASDQRSDLLVAAHIPILTSLDTVNGEDMSRLTQINCHGSPDLERDIFP